MGRTTSATRVASAAALLAAATLTAPAPVRAIDAGSITPVPTHVDAAATAVLANLTMVHGRSPGYITANACSALQAGPQQQSNGNFQPDQTLANLAVVRIDRDGRFCIANQAPVDLVADVEAYLAPATAGGLVFEGAAAVRVLDTRASAQPADNSITRVATDWAGSAAVLVNIVMTGAGTDGYVAAGPCTAMQAGNQSFSNGNFRADATVSNLSVVAVDADGSFCVYSQRATHLIVDVQGAFTSPSPAGLGFDTVELPRALDTRLAPSVTPADGTITRVNTGAPRGTTAVLVNIGMVDGAGPGYITADECSALHPGEQTRSNGNHSAAIAVSNLSLVPIDADGAFCIYNQTTVDLTVDVQGVLSPNGSQHFFPVPTSRVLDTRPLTPPGPVTSCTSVVHIGDSTSVGMISPAVLTNPEDRIDAQYRRVGVTDVNLQISGARSIVETLPGQINAYDVATSIKRAGYHGCWVFALGVTDTANVAVGSGPGRLVRIQKMMDLVAGDQVMWLTTRTYVKDGAWSENSMLLWNAALDQAAPIYPNLHLFDWASVAQRGWYAADAIHYTAEGYTQRARLIADALAAIFPSRPIPTVGDASRCQDCS